MTTVEWQYRWTEDVDKLRQTGDPAAFASRKRRLYTLTSTFVNQIKSSLNLEIEQKNLQEIQTDLQRNCVDDDTLKKIIKLIRKELFKQINALDTRSIQTITSITPPFFCKDVILIIDALRRDLIPLELDDSECTQLCEHLIDYGGCEYAHLLSSKFSNFTSRFNLVKKIIEEMLAVDSSLIIFFDTFAWGFLNDELFQKGKEFLKGLALDGRKEEMVQVLNQAFLVFNLPEGADPEKSIQRAEDMANLFEEGTYGRSLAFLKISEKLVEIGGFEDLVSQWIDQINDELFHAYYQGRAQSFFRRLFPLLVKRKNFEGAEKIAQKLRVFSDPFFQTIMVGSEMTQENALKEICRQLLIDGKANQAVNVAQRSDYRKYLLKYLIREILLNPHLDDLEALAKGLLYLLIIYLKKFDLILDRISRLGVKTILEKFGVNHSV